MINIQGVHRLPYTTNAIFDARASPCLPSILGQNNARRNFHLPFTRQIESKTRLEDSSNWGAREWAV